MWARFLHSEFYTVYGIDYTIWDKTQTNPDCIPNTLYQWRSKGSLQRYIELFAKHISNQILFSLQYSSAGFSRDYTQSFRRHLNVFGPGHFRSIWLAMVRFLAIILNWPMRDLFFDSEINFYRSTWVKRWEKLLRGLSSRISIT